MIVRLLSIFLGTLIAGTVPASEYEKWSLPQSQQQDEEYLLYRVSYRGLFTAYTWKDLADAAIITGRTPFEFNQRKTCLLSLKLSTEDFSLAELFYPVRFYWRTTVTPDLNYVHLVEAIDNGKKQRHELAWLDLQNDHIEVYRKRKKVPAEVLTYDDEDEGETPELVWESGDKKEPPGFVNKQPRLEGRLNYFVHEKTVAVASDEPIVDPLALIYSTRWNDFAHQQQLDFTVPYEDAFRKYHARFIAQETLEIGKQNVAALKIEIRRDQKEDEKNEGFMLLWLSDDERRLPLQFLVDARFGRMKLSLSESSLMNEQSYESCVRQSPNLSQIHTQRHNDSKPASQKKR